MSESKLNRVLVTGATGGMGYETLKCMVDDLPAYQIVLLARGSEKNKKKLASLEGLDNVRVIWGDLNDRAAVDEAIAACDMVFHIAAFVSPQADYDPQRAMKVNFGGTKNLVDVIIDQGRADEVKFVYIGTVAETGDRMPPIHWGRVGDPIKPSMFDYYAVSKVAAERYVIEAGLSRWVSLRQTGIIGPAMSEVRDAIMFHNPFDNVLEYVSDRDSGFMMANLAKFDAAGTLDDSFWGHVYNIGGGKWCRASTYQMYQELYGAMGLTHLEYALDPKQEATRNFHGHFYLDSDKLEHHLHFQRDSMQYYYDCFLAQMGPAVAGARALCAVPGGQRLMGAAIKASFAGLAHSEHGTAHFTEDGLEDHVEAYWGSRRAWEDLPKSLADMEHFEDWDNVVPIDHGYDETKPEAELDIDDVRGAAEFRGGELLSQSMEKGDWTTKLRFRCQLGHEFKASPRLVLEGGHWCDECERKSWNYGQRARGDKFFAQVWDPIHEADELREYPKCVTELDI